MKGQKIKQYVWIPTKTKSKEVTILNKLGIKKSNQLGLLICFESKEVIK